MEKAANHQRRIRPHKNNKALKNEGMTMAIYTGNNFSIEFDKKNAGFVFEPKNSGASGPTSGADALILAELKENANAIIASMQGYFDAWINKDMLKEGPTNGVDLAELQEKILTPLAKALKTSTGSGDSKMIALSALALEAADNSIQTLVQTPISPDNTLYRGQKRLTEDEIKEYKEISVANNLTVRDAYKVAFAPPEEPAYDAAAMAAAMKQSDAQAEENNAVMAPQGSALATPPVEAPVVPKQLNPSEVAKVQRGLNSLKELGVITGFDLATSKNPEGDDGIAGPKTKKAVEIAQKALGMDVDGKITPEFTARLDQKIAEVRAQKVDVKVVQTPSTTTTERFTVAASLADKQEPEAKVVEKAVEPKLSAIDEHIRVMTGGMDPDKQNRYDPNAPSLWAAFKDAAGSLFGSDDPKAEVAGEKRKPAPVDELSTWAATGEPVEPPQGQQNPPLAGTGPMKSV
ncbi:MAG: peptidoglycan-binding protein [Alphaproteobacteria bacterium]|nr:peptidoglycan-binding protein [Alphaproteobacteria bacterium]